MMIGKLFCLVRVFICLRLERFRVGIAFLVWLVEHSERIRHAHKDETESGEAYDEYSSA